MVKSLFLGLLLLANCGFVIAAPKGHYDPKGHSAPRGQQDPDDFEDPAARNERSTNLSHVTGTARKIQMFIKNRHLQILPGGIVNGTTDDTSPYTILQRMTVGVGQMKIQGVATCQYLCMDECGLLYGSIEFGDECILNETIEETNYNKYSSSKYSNDKRTFYLALNKRGQPRKVVIRARQQLGKLSSFARVLTRTVTNEIHPMRHHNHLCSAPSALHHPQTPNDPPRCRKRKKKKKKKRKHGEDNESRTSDPSDTSNSNKNSNLDAGNKSAINRIKCEKDNEGCQRDLTLKNNTNKKNNSEKPLVNSPKKKKKKINSNKKGVRKRPDQVEPSQEQATTSTAAPVPTTTSDDVMTDEDYGPEGADETSTHPDWEDATGLPDVPMTVDRLNASTHLSISDYYYPLFS